MTSLENKPPANHLLGPLIKEEALDFLSGTLTLEPARKAHPLASLSTSVIGCLGIGGVTEAEGKLLSFQEPPFLPRLGRTDGKDG